MKKILLMSVILFGLFVLSGCWKKVSTADQPVESPVCPEWYYWFDSVKSCILTEDSFAD